MTTVNKKMTQKSKKAKINKDLLICRFTNCLKYVYEPIILQCCQETICKQHIDDLFQKQGDQSNNEILFKCCFCQKETKINKNDEFKINEQVLNILTNDSDLFMSKKEQEIRNTINKLESFVQHAYSVLKDPYCFVYDKISDVKNNIDIQREELIKQINDIIRLISLFVRK